MGAQKPGALLKRHLNKPCWPNIRLSGARVPLGGMKANEEDIPSVAIVSPSFTPHVVGSGQPGVLLFLRRPAKSRFQILNFGLGKLEVEAQVVIGGVFHGS